MHTYLTDSNFTINNLSLVILIALLVSCYQNKKPEVDYTRSFFWMLCFSLAQTIVDSLFCVAYNEQKRHLMYVFSSYTFVFGYCATLSFCIFLYRFCRVNSGENKNWYRGLVVTGVLLVLQAVTVILLTRFGVMGFPEDSPPISPASRTLILYGMPLPILMLNFLLVVNQEMSIRKKVILSTYCLIPLCAIPLMLLGVRRNQSFVVVQNVLIYCHIFVIQGRELAESEAELNTSRMETMFSQIQPHFLYNALSSCINLCEEDPALAKKTLLDFSRYLRTNLDSLSKKEPIPFKQELEHTQTYLHIEQVRFGERVKVVYDLQDTDFMLPALTLQPLAENAVKHGITMKRYGGTVTIRSYHDKNNYYVEVEDDGVGFESLPEGLEHIGIRNIQGRLASMVGGTLSYESRLNIGTRAVIKLPMKGM